jgi:hypothetical protein
VSLKKKIYKIKPNKVQMKILREGWKRFQRDFDYFWGEISITEKWMSRKTGIEGIEFFKDDMCGDWCGVGNADRTMALIHREELE